MKEYGTNPPQCSRQGVTALSNPYRRRLLAGLVETKHDGVIDPVAVLSTPPTDSEEIEVRLIHHHLPQLEQQGFINWNRDQGTVARGPAWEDVAPVVTMLQTHRDDLPEGRI